MWSNSTEGFVVIRCYQRAVHSLWGPWGSSEKAPYSKHTVMKYISLSRVQTSEPPLRKKYHGSLWPHPVALYGFILWHYVAHPMALCGNGRVEIPLLVTCIEFRFFCKVNAHSGMLHRRHVGNKSENVNRGSQRHKSEFFCSVTPTLQGMNCHIFPLEKVAMEPLFSTVRTTDCSLRFGS